MITSFFAPKENSKTRTRKSERTNTTEEIDNAKRSKTSDSVSNRQSKSKSKLTPEVNVPTEVEVPPHVKELMSHLTDESWKKALFQYTSTKPNGKFSQLAKFVSTERMSKNKQVFPPPCDTFTALNLVPLHKVKVVIVGQDPYHGVGQGHGLAFSVRKGVKIPPSLRNIYKELVNNNDGIMPTHGYLERWARQGVLMLNAVLTVRKGEAFSHAKRGWEDFTDEIIRLLFTHRSKDSPGLVFLLWGKPAAKKAETIINRYKGRGSSIGMSSSGGSNSNNNNNNKHVVICTSHPSPLGATKTKSPFMGSKCFSRANSALKEMGVEPIHWGVDGPLALKQQQQSVPSENADVDNAKENDQSKAEPKPEVARFITPTSTSSSDADSTAAAATSILIEASDTQCRSDNEQEISDV